MINKRIPLPFTALLLALPLLAPAAQANVVIAGTRVIYPADQREVTLRLDNRGELPALVQVWVDDGNKDTPIGQLKVPFVITPVISRIEARNGQTLRLSYTGGGSLPTDKESVYWLNLLDIPPQSAKKQDANLLQMALRTRIKIFYRPAALDADGAAAAISALRWSTVNGSLLATNNSGYYVNVASVTYSSGGRKFSTIEGGMVAPGQTQPFKFNAPAGGIAHGAQIGYVAINDFGGETTAQAKVN
ncbi:fimbria/pilus periplasmic chaperone [Serratia proteamaculans]|uniref:Fimbria/pilus periplasmic chaperone n=1 Tax=Serratia proteamaculans TaxID=28151 RepID=A0A5Q2VJ58_SERPR|nr:fimbria/pilus periplasmic chaperone [Serratia proteamaculans]QGH63925.1 fimbria/pilus periplasmic chaperone [Serratia proteamaculans]